MTDKLKTNNHSIWRATGFLIQATNRPSLYKFANLNPECEFKTMLSRWDRFKIGVWFLLESARGDHQ